MATLAELQARVRRLEQRQPRRWSGSAVWPMPTPAPEQMRTVLKMFIEAGGLVDPPNVDTTAAEATTSASTVDLKVPRVRTALRALLHSQPDYGQEDDSNTALDAGTSDPAGPIFDAAQRRGV